MRELLNALSQAVDGRDLRVFLAMWTASEHRHLTAKHSAIARSLGVSTSSVQRSIARLETVGLVKSDRMGKKGQGYLIQPEHVFFIPVAKRGMPAQQIAELAELDRSELTELDDLDRSIVTDLEPGNRSKLTDLGAKQRRKPLRTFPSKPGNTEYGGGQRTHARTHACARDSEADAKAAAAALILLGFSEQRAEATRNHVGAAVVMAALKRADERKPKNVRGFVGKLVDDPEFCAEVQADETRRADLKQRGDEAREQRQRQAEADAAHATQEAQRVEAERVTLEQTFDRFNEAQILAALDEVTGTLDGFARRSADNAIRKLKSGERTARQIAIGPIFRNAVVAVLDATETSAKTHAGSKHE